jgi:hypothetical protein
VASCDTEVNKKKKKIILILMKNNNKKKKKLLVQRTDWLAAASVHCAKSCIYNQKVLLGMGEFVA